MHYIEKLAKKENVEVTEKLRSMVRMSENDMTIKDAMDIFDNYKDELVKTKYFPEYKKYFDGIGNANDFEVKGSYKK